MSQENAKRREERPNLSEDRESADVDDEVRTSLPSYRSRQNLTRLTPLQFSWVEIFGLKSADIPKEVLSARAALDEAWQRVEAVVKDEVSR